MEEIEYVTTPLAKVLSEQARRIEETNRLGLAAGEAQRVLEVRGEIARAFRQLGDALTAAEWHRRAKPAGDAPLLRSAGEILNGMAARVAEEARSEIRAVPEAQVLLEGEQARALGVPDGTRLVLRAVLPRPGGQGESVSFRPGGV